ncbi:MAG: twin-arginine translocase subunit TatC [Acidobacteria bacterium]|nr:twin-arginine translocase subunit TatC [Acidobacteriota bacterium]
MALVPFRKKDQVEDQDSAKPDDLQSSLPDEAGEEELETGAKMSFLEHLEELRKRIVNSLIAIVVAMGLSFFFIDKIFDFIMEPLARVLPPGSRMMYAEPTEALVLYLKMGGLTGILVSAPFIMWQVWLFIAPGLYTKEKKFALPFIFLTSICFIGGAAFSHYMLFPFAWQYLASFGSDYLVFLPRIEPVFSLYIKLMLGMALIFQIPTIVLFLARMGLVTAGLLARKTKYAILIIFIVAAVITPTADPMTQTLMAAPMIGLYLLSIGIAWVFGKRNPKRA